MKKNWLRMKFVFECNWGWVPPPKMDLTTLLPFPPAFSAEHSKRVPRGALRRQDTFAAVKIIWRDVKVGGGELKGKK